jgi:anhydro-N-acetylmuramic acid kinase
MRDIIGPRPDDKPLLLAGAMSGTSADGVDVALVRVQGPADRLQATLLLHHHRPYPPDLQQAIRQIRLDGNVALRRLSEITRVITLTYAAAANEAVLGANVVSQDLAAVAAHGQTMFHDPPLTMQCLDPSLLAAEVGCRVISDFRRADCAAGGQGAPLVPFADYMLFRHPSRRRAVLNIGGIANVTLLRPGATLDEVVAFDTGPGNCLSDWLMGPTGRSHDPGGTGALRGRAIGSIVDRVIQDPYFARRPPKSTDGPAMIAMFRDAILQEGAAAPALDDLLATACRITARSIAAALAEQDFHPDELIVSGGGTANAAIMSELQALFQGVVVSDDLGIPSPAREAVAFAILGYASLHEIPANLPRVTGARRAVVLGSITAGSNATAATGGFSA